MLLRLEPFRRAFTLGVLLERAEYIKAPSKYHFSDPGLWNPRLGFRQIEETHLMENFLCNDLIRRGFDVDVGIVETASLLRIPDPLKKMVIVQGFLKPGRDGHGIQGVGIEQFLLDESLLRG